MTDCTWYLKPIQKGPLPTTVTMTVDAMLSGVIPVLFMVVPISVAAMSPAIGVTMNDIYLDRSLLYVAGAAIMAVP